MSHGITVHHLAHHSLRDLHVINDPLLYSPPISLDWPLIYVTRSMGELHGGNGMRDCHLISSYHDVPESTFTHTRGYLPYDPGAPFRAVCFSEPACAWEAHRVWEWATTLQHRCLWLEAGRGWAASHSQFAWIIILLYDDSP